MALSKFTSHSTHINEVSKRDKNDLARYDEDDSDTIRVLPCNDRKRRRCDSGVHLDERFEGVLANPTGLQEKTGASANTRVNCLQSSNGIMPKMSSPASDQDNDQRLCEAINQPLPGADQMVLLPLATVKALHNEIAELRNAFGSFKNDSRKQFISYEEALNARLPPVPVGMGWSDDEEDDDCSPQALQNDKAARKVAVERVRRLAKHLGGKERAHLEFMAGVVGVEHKSKLSIGHSIQKLVDPELRAYTRQRLLEDYVAQLWRHTYEGSFAKPDFVALGEDVERLYGRDAQRP